MLDDGQAQKQAYQKQYLMDHQAERREYFRSYYQKNRLKLIEKAKRRWRENPDVFRASQKRYRKNHALEIKVAKALGMTITQARAELQKGR